MSFLPDWITGFDSANAEAAAEADAKLQTMNAQTYGPFYQPQDSQPYGSAQQQAEIDNVFFEEATRFPRWSAAAVTRYLGEIFKLVPWWVWAGAAVAAFYWLGGFALLKGSLNKARR
jgi:hypothetical protein